MTGNLIKSGLILAGALACASAALAQDPSVPAAGGGGGRRGILAHNPANDNKPFDKHDLNGVWSRNGSPAGYGGGGTCRDCGDRGFSNDVPPLTPLGQKMFDANKPSYGRNLGSPDAAAHPEEAIGRRRAVPPANGTDPYQACNPEGIPRALIYPDPIEFTVLKDRVLQHFEWGYQLRTIWTDGRQPNKDPIFSAGGVTLPESGRGTRSSWTRMVSIHGRGSITTAIRTRLTCTCRNVIRGSITTSWISP